MRRLDRDEVSAVVHADRETVFRVISDVPRTPEWSPEVVRCEWLDGVDRATVGARFAARNRKRWFAWTNRPQITAVEPGERFAFSRTERGGGTIEWSWRLAPDGPNTTVTLGYEVLRPVPIALHVILRVLLGVKDLRADLHANMTGSLHRLDRIIARPTNPASATPEPM
jgi:Polyketide cyclase / dehydrase and lipid transport